MKYEFVYVYFLFAPATAGSHSDITISAAAPLERIPEGIAIPCCQTVLAMHAARILLSMMFKNHLES
jgi:hypothetical protein